MTADQSSRSSSGCLKKHPFYFLEFMRVSYQSPCREALQHNRCTLHDRNLDQEVSELPFASVATHVLGHFSLGEDSKSVLHSEIKIGRYIVTEAFDCPSTFSACNAWLSDWVETSSLVGVDEIDTRIVEVDSNF